ncbi:MAG: hypothetical protein MK106_11850 [Mariniblastus sp.]|nr:hypothetical protein [Mariniblastus sp.]
MKRTSTYLSCSGICLALILCLSSAQSLIGQDDLFAVPGSPPVQEPAIPNIPAAPEDVPNFQAPDNSVSNFDPYIPEQKKEVNERFAGWRQAGQGKNIERLDDEFRANWVMSDSNGRIDGTITTYGDSNLLNMRVSLLNKGRVVSQTRADAFGRFRFNNVRPGTYTLAGFGDSALFVFGFNVLAFNEEAVDRTPTSIDVMAVPNATSINLDWIRYFSPQVVFRVYGRYVSDDVYNNTAWEESKNATGMGMLDGQAEVQGPARLHGVKGLSSNYPEHTAATSIATHATNLTEDGRLIGRIHQVNSIHGRPVELRNTRVMLLKDDDVVTAETTDNYGVFELLDVDPGNYALVAVGEDGVGCIGIKVTAEAGGTLPIDFTMATAESVGWLNHLAVATAYQRVINRPRPTVETGQAGQECNCGDACQCGDACSGNCGGAGKGWNGAGNTGNCRGVGGFWRFIDSWSEAYYYGVEPQTTDTSCRDCGPEWNGTIGIGGVPQHGGPDYHGHQAIPNTPIYTPIIDESTRYFRGTYHGAHRPFSIPNRIQFRR